MEERQPWTIDATKHQEIEDVKNLKSSTNWTLEKCNGALVVGQLKQRRDRTKAMKRHENFNCFEATHLSPVLFILRSPSGLSGLK